MGGKQTYWARCEAAERKRLRIEAVRRQTGGAHAYNDWLILRDTFGACVRCGAPEPLERDHIVPLHLGGCDCIGNIQPLCWLCNHTKYGDATDYRFAAMPDWFVRYRENMRAARRIPFMGFDYGPAPDNATEG